MQHITKRMLNNEINKLRRHRIYSIQWLQFDRLNYLQSEIETSFVRDYFHLIGTSNFRLQTLNNFYY